MHAIKNPTHIKSHFTLKGSLFTLTTLVLESDDLAGIEHQLVQAVKQAPNFFDNTPVVIDLKKMDEKSFVDFQLLLGLLRQFKLIPVGISGGALDWQKHAMAAGLAILADNKKSQESHSIQNNSVKSRTKVITTPVRSGQQIYAQGGDLIVLAPVSVGAELLADGHIHVYNALRGRALAGVLGDTSAHIFCMSLEAELVSIAGQYKVSEQLLESGWKVSANIELYEGNLKIHKL